ncbi:MAG: sulfatase [Myxococcales bacterium]|nr:sulfatase [Myxococcales bacterium]
MRSTFHLVLAAAALGLAFASLGCTSRDAGPDVIVIVVDTLRQDRLGTGGHDRPVSPAIDRLAADGIVFGEARAVASWTKPTVASILTGYTPRRHGALRYDEGLGRVPTLATRLSLAGYAARAVVANPFLDGAGFERGFERFQNLSRKGRWQVPGRVVTNGAIRALEDHDQVFLYVHYLDPHDPYEPADGAHKALVRPYDGPAEGSMAFMRGPLLRKTHPVSDADVAHLLDLYDAEIRTVDAAIGRLLDWLRAAGRYDDAWIVLTSDHGEEFHDHGGWLHSYTLYEEQLHVPLIVKPPARLGIAPGRRDALVGQIDVVPTLLDGLGLAADDPPEGRSLLPLMRDPAAGDPDRILFSEQGFGRQSGRVGLGSSGRQGALKWIQVDGEYSHQPTPPHGECYDLASDPDERRNLARPGGDHPCRELAAAVDAWRRGERTEGVALDIPAETEERLRALGYTP